MELDGLGQTAGGSMMALMINCSDGTYVVPLDMNFS